MEVVVITVWQLGKQNKIYYKLITNYQRNETDADCVFAADKENWPLICLPIRCYNKETDQFSHSTALLSTIADSAAQYFIKLFINHLVH